MPLAAESTAPAHLTPVTAATTQGRILSVDVLRGFDMFWIIGGDALFYALNKMAGANRIVHAVADQLDHVPWAGLHFYDCIFPLFVFIVGVSIVFSLTKRAAVAGRAAAAGQVIRRFVILYIFGLITYKGIADGYEQIRLLGVLQRIALCYLFAGLAFLYLKPRGLVALCVTLLVGYWAMMTFVPVPGVGAGHFEEGKNLANYVDQQFLPLRKWDGDHDPEGLLSTLPAIASCLLGIFAGLLLQRSDVPDARKVRMLLGWGAAGVVLGFLWGLQFPVIKKIWTSSFVLAAGGFSAIALGIFYQIIDVSKKTAWIGPFLWIGTNAITIYMVAHVLELDKLAQRLVGGEIQQSLNSSVNGAGDLLVTVVVLTGAILFCRFLYKRRIFIKV